MAYIYNGLVVLPKMEDLDQLRDAVKSLYKVLVGLMVSLPTLGW